MTAQKTPTGPDFEALREAIGRREPDLLITYSSDDAEISVVNADAQRSPPFELRGKAEIAKHLRAVSEQEPSCRIEGEVFEEGWAEYREACEYPDGTRVLVETTLELVGNLISRQVEVVSRDDGPARREGAGKGGERT